MAGFSVLLVDDEEEYIRALAERLEIRGLDVRVALRGEQAIGMVHEKKPDVMVLDLKMPGIDGMVVLSQVKRMAPEIQVIMVTGHGSEKDREAARRLGVFDYLQKPVDIDVLLRSMSSAYEASKEKSG